MPISLSVRPQFASVEVLVTAIEDSFGKRTTKYRKELLVLIVCAVCFLLGLPYITNVSPERRSLTSTSSITILIAIIIDCILSYSIHTQRALCEHV